MDSLEFEVVAGPWRCGTDYHGVKVTSISGPDDLVVYVYVSNVQVDLDGAPDAYGPPGKKARDSLRNARDHPDLKKGWYGVYAMTPQDAARHNVKIDSNPSLADVHGKFPVIQGAEQPKQGFYVSQSSVVANSSMHKWDQRRYVDATSVPFGALAGKLAKEGFVLGDLCLSLRPDKGLQSAYSFMDGAGKSSAALSEVSYKTFSELGGSGFTPHEVNQRTNFLCCHLAFQESSATTVDWILGRLSKAKNASDLPLFLACQLLVKPTGYGLDLFENYRKASVTQRLKMPLPHDYHVVVSQLRKAGYVFMDYGDFNATLSGTA